MDIDVTRPSILLAELMALSIEAHKHLVDITVTISGHVNSVMIMIVTDCSYQMYLDGKQPEPVIHVIFSLNSENAEQFIGATIDSATDLIAERKDQDKDAAEWSVKNHKQPIKMTCQSHKSAFTDFTIHQVATVLRQ